jgi:hypothetical protein
LCPGLKPSFLYINITVIDDQKIKCTCPRPMCGREPGRMQVGLNNWNGLGCRRSRSVLETGLNARPDYSRFSMCIFMDSFVYHSPISDGSNELKYHQTCKILALNHEMCPAKCVGLSELFDFWFSPQIHRWIRHHLAQTVDGFVLIAPSTLLLCNTACHAPAAAPTRGNADDCRVDEDGQPLLPAIT